MKRTIAAGTALFALVMLPVAAHAEGDVYAGFPVTLKGYEGSAATSVSYGGQIARQVLHDSLKKLAGKGTGAPDAELKAKMTAYFEGKGRRSCDHRTGHEGPVRREAERRRRDQQGHEPRRQDLQGRGAGHAQQHDRAGSWCRSGSTRRLRRRRASMRRTATTTRSSSPSSSWARCSTTRPVDNYLDEKLRADTKPNDKPYKEGAAYTGKEHSWDEAFGYFGTPAHTLMLTPKAVYEIAKQGSKSDKPEDALAYADLNQDGAVDLKSEMTFGPAYYAAAFDKSGTDYLHTITRAFLDGRKVITEANGAALTDGQRSALQGHAETIRTNWERVLGEAVFKYAGSVYKDLGKLETILDSGGDPAKVFRAYAKHWGELKGFALALQTGRDNLGETAVRLNRIIGFGPVLLNLSQVTDIDSQGNYVKDESKPLATYQYDMLKLQNLMVSAFGVEARQKRSACRHGIVAGEAGRRRECRERLRGRPPPRRPLRWRASRGDRR